MNDEAVLQLYAESGGGGIMERDETLRLLDSLLAVASEIERGANESLPQGRETSLLALTLISLCTMAGILVRNIRITEANNRAIFTAMKATYQIFQKLPLDKNVYHNLLDHALRSLQAVLHPTVTKICQKCQTEGSIHGVLTNLAVKLAGNVFDLLDFDDRNFENSKLSSLLESLNCTL
ncbi:hypothetical protein, partial [Anaplasma bovis]|uniref:hypothetical protein n=1 Tax=Anaplasma bovis TaxID=186733 RepID=UPI002FF258FA